MEYEPFDFDKLDALLSDLEHDKKPEPEEMRTIRFDSSAAVHAAQTPAQSVPAPAPQPADLFQHADYSDDPYSGWPQPETAPHGHARADRPSHSSALRTSSRTARPVQEESPVKKAKPRRAPDADVPRKRVAVLEDEPPEQDAPAPRKKHRVLKTLLFLMVLCGALLVAILKFNFLQPLADSSAGLGARKTGASVILLAGTDKGGSRTDTMMLAYLNVVSGECNLLSIPRDTLVNAGYNVPKLNACYGVNGGGKEGMEALMDKVQAIIGYRPDGYLLTDLDSFVSLVDLMGGVEFDVPQDMYYQDPTQNLSINLTAGEQKLDGEQAMGLVRYRYGYATADIQRTSVQRDFISACMAQWLTVKNVVKFPAALALVQTSLETDLNAGNLIWLAGALKRCGTGNMETMILPGGGQAISGGSYYVLSAPAVADAINASCNPYQADVRADRLGIRTY
ncbi:MAG: LCP family protein [Oscillospiraceae bacterium]|nr:LCP family protein [Oscillospiraceae bacterium]